MVDGLALTNSQKSGIVAQPQHPTQSSDKIWFLSLSINKQGDNMTTTQIVYFIFLVLLFLYANQLQRGIGYQNCLNDIKNVYPDLHEELVKRSKELRESD